MRHKLLVLNLYEIENHRFFCDIHSIFCTFMMTMVWTRTKNMQKNKWSWMKYELFKQIIVNCCIFILLIHYVRMYCTLLCYVCNILEQNLCLQTSLVDWPIRLIIAPYSYHLVMRSRCIFSWLIFFINYFIIT